MSQCSDIDELLDQVDEVLEQCRLRGIDPLAVLRRAVQEHDSKHEE